VIVWHCFGTCASAGTTVHLPKDRSTRSIWQNDNSQREARIPGQTPVPLPHIPYKSPGLRIINLFMYLFSAALCLLGLWVQIPPRAWMYISGECCLLPGIGLCDGLITFQRSPTECGVSECDRLASIMRRPWPTRGCCVIGKKTFYLFIYLFIYLHCW
jgi:hypothetical protein